MLAINNLSKKLQLGQLFVDFASLRKSIQNWAVRDKFNFRTTYKDRS